VKPSAGELEYRPEVALALGFAVVHLVTAAVLAWLGTILGEEGDPRRAARCLQVVET
jgi:hypothetical protein